MDRPNFVPISRLTGILKILCVVMVVTELADIIHSLWLHDFLLDVQSGAVDDVTFDAKANQIDGVGAVLAFAYLGSFIASAVTACIWIHRAAQNLRAAEMLELRFSPGWSVAWYFIPIASLWKPYQAMKEIWQASSFQLNWKDVAVPGLLPLWWAGWLASNAIGQISYRMGDNAETIPQLMNMTAIYVGGSILHIIAIILFILVVSKISAKQEAYSEVGVSEVFA